jgi:hypothetical protein
MLNAVGLQNVGVELRQQKLPAPVFDAPVIANVLATARKTIEVIRVLEDSDGLAPTSSTSLPQCEGGCSRWRP